MKMQGESIISGITPSAHISRAWGLIPVFVAAIYPLFLQGFHSVISTRKDEISFTTTAIILLGAAFIVPILGLIFAMKGPDFANIRRLAYMVVTTPALYTLLGTLQGMTRSPIPEDLVWYVLWFSFGILTILSTKETKDKPSNPEFTVYWKVIHGLSATLVSIFIVFHITNHFFSLKGADTYNAVMKLGEKVYRNPFVEPILIIFFFFQILTGIQLMWRWSTRSVPFYQSFQVASGIYLAVFLLSHLNAVLIYARIYLNIPSDFAFGSAAPAGIIQDPWNIRLFPYYTLGVFFALCHLMTGIRTVALVKYKSHRTTISRIWVAMILVSGIASGIIIAGMSGVRI
ncbi:hypothetical protein [Candidatus Nitrosacidococcus tergens]|uniref:Uncharacterized protein n=1 Tax=Candidatus Nitrosacidococcus tergens TaxID=553981 RepID=A0A7G1Q8H2_9GAMM|nr:hypothetical protein [Candidatus Nitrosacidococcus tergens]CAB1275197.1 conserved membrane protein of unknown function [Candidatus Nitrosacidococcus tergens]